MPLYEYECTACGRLTETLQRLSDPPLAECPACGGAVRKLLSAPAFQFKGSGWYVTDYARRGQKDAKPDAGKGKADPGGDPAASGNGAKAKSDKPAEPAAGSSSD